MTTTTCSKFTDQPTYSRTRARTHTHTQTHSANIGRKERVKPLEVRTWPEVEVVTHYCYAMALNTPNPVLNGSKHIQEVALDQSKHTASVTTTHIQRL